MATTDRPPRRMETVVPPPAPRHLLEPTTQFKTTWLVSSLNVVRERGRYERYLGLLPSEHRAALESMVVGGWAPIDVALAHYRACDGLGFTAAEQLEIGANVTKRLQGTLLSAAVRLAAQTADLWTVLGQIHRLWDRMFIGGGVAVYRLGPKEARAEFLGCRLAEVPYFRNGLQGVLSGIGSLFAKKLYVSEVVRETTDTTIVYRGSWV